MTARIEVTAHTPDGPYTVVGPIRVRAKQQTAFSRPRTTDDVDAKLREEAARRGANAVINVQYRYRRFPLWCYRALDGTGTAVLAVELYRGCPSCRERMRRDASVCPHCRRSTEPWTLHGGYWWVARPEGRYYLDPSTDQWRPAEAPPGN